METAREYDFDLPVLIPGIKLYWGLSWYKADPVYMRLPDDLRERLEYGEANEADVEITADDLDRLSDEDFAYIRQAVGF